MTLRTVAVLPSLLVASLLLPGCAGPSQPVEIPQEEVPFSLSRSASPRATAEPHRSLVVYFARHGRLHPVSRTVPSSTREVEAALEALLAGPGEDEVARSVDSAIPAQTRLLQVLVVDGVANVDLSAEFQAPAPSDRIVLRVAQVVWTVVRVPDVSAVRFLIEGTEIGVLGDDSRALERPATAADFQSVAPLAP